MRSVNKMYIVFISFCNRNVCIKMIDFRSLIINRSDGEYDCFLFFFFVFSIKKWYTSRHIFIHASYTTEVRIFFPPDNFFFLFACLLVRLSSFRRCYCCCSYFQPQVWWYLYDYFQYLTCSISWLHVYWYRSMFAQRWWK